MCKHSKFILPLLVIFLSLVLGACEKDGTAPTATSDKQNQEQSSPLSGTENLMEPTVLAEAGQKPSAQAKWEQHILNYNQGWVPAAQPLVIQFTHAVAEEEALNSSVKELIKIVPETEFEAKLVAVDTLHILPAKRWPAGKVFSISLLPARLKDIPASLEPFQFQIQALKQDYELQLSGLVPGAKKNHMSLRGTVRTSDSAEAADIESTLSLKHEGKTLNLNWTHAPDQLRHEFVAEEISRAEKESTLTLNYSAEIIGVEKKGKRDIAVPAINEFRITGARSIQRPRQYVEVSFSEALDRNQNFNGLVLLDGATASASVNGSLLHIYPPSPLSGTVKLEITDTLRGSRNLQLASAYTTEVTFISELPGVRFVGKGSIIPPTDSLSVPFEAINVNSIQVTAFKVYKNNIQNFLQNHTLATSYTDNQSGRYLWRKKINLPSVPFDKWQRYDIDLNELMAKHSDGIVNLQISIDRSNIAYVCPEDTTEVREEKLQNYNGPNVEDLVERPAWFYRYYSEQNGYYSYEERNDPCDTSYYRYYATQNISDARNFIVSDIGLIAKKGSDNNIQVVATSITSGEALRNVRVDLFNYQHQLLATAQTNNQGMATLTTDKIAFYVIAEHKSGRSFLRFPRNEALPSSQFDTQGEKLATGIKGFIYGERDVWRPGDSIYLSFMLEDKTGSLPEGHPVSLDFFDPRDSKVITLVNTQPIGNIYTFKLQTSEDAPTGDWRAVVRVGGEYFDKMVKVETITPNRLKVEVTPASRPLQLVNSPIQTELFAQWLNGATAKNLQADANLKLTPMKTEFPGYSQFVFDDPAGTFRLFEQTVFDGQLNSEGRANFSVDLKQIPQAPGKLRATFVTRVFEQSGNFSTSIRTEEVLPYENWVGLFVPEGNGYMGAISREEDHSIEVLAIDSAGKPLTERKLQLSVYSIDWRWWWDQSQEDLSNYVLETSNNRIKHIELQTDKQGRARWTLAKNEYDWGRHLIRVCAEDGHCSGKEVYLGWSWNNQVNPDAATQLMLATDKESYQPGDIARISIPELKQGKILYSLENGSMVLEQKWLELKPGARSFDISITAEMAPNVYLHAMLLLPHQQRESDAPIRLYGITPLLVNDPQNRLEPVLETPESVRPESRFQVVVKEANNRKMNYTLAVVDEGLLGITGYNAPDPYDRFYKREALGVFTWDMFDSVIGAYGANLERLLKIGGGDQLEEDRKNRERRFPPVVRFLGAFTLEAGKSQTHEVILPPYMGAVRVMAVAGNDGAYGKAEKSITVTQPLTLLATLPRVVGPGEKVSLPVNVFVSDDKIKNVDVKLQTNDMFVAEQTTQQIAFSEQGDQIALLELQVQERIGKGEVTVVATSGEEKAEQTIFIDVRSPNRPSTKMEAHVLQPGESWQPTLQPHGMLGTNTASVSVSSFPAMNLDKRLGYLIRYPHGCIEQTTSALFPQITLHKLVNLSEAQQHDIQHHVDSAMNKYRRFQTGDGAFAYWPGDTYTNNWASIYATHFLVEAKELGYAVPNDLLQNALTYLSKLSMDTSQDYVRLVEAYRLYVLALASKADLSAMNRLRETLLKRREHYSDQVARWKLAMAYQRLGLNNITEELMRADENIAKAYDHVSYTYGSALRDQALLLLAYIAVKDETETWNMVSELARQLSRDEWHSTQSVAWALIALSKYAATINHEKNLFSINESSDVASGWQNLETTSSVYKQALSTENLINNTFAIRNDSQHKLHVEVSNTGVPVQGEETASNKGLSMTINFMDMNGNALNVANLPQGKDFIAEVTISADEQRTSWKIEDIAMVLAVPSGWQIRNERLEGEAVPDGLDYQDIRDDAVLSYFSLWKSYYWYYRYNDQNHSSQTIRVKLNASFAGRFYLPGWQVYAMYDENIAAYSRGQWVEVIPQ